MFIHFVSCQVKATRQLTSLNEPKAFDILIALTTIGGLRSFMCEISFFSCNLVSNST